MVRFSRNNIVDVDEYEKRIRRNGKIYFDKDVVEKYHRKIACSKGALYEMYLDTMIQRSAGRYQFDNKENIIPYLQKCERCPGHYFANRKTQSESLDKKRVLEPLYQNGYATEFLTYYMEYRSMKSRESTANSLLNSVKGLPTIKNQDGVALTPLTYNVTPQFNLRFNYSQHDIIAQIPKEISNSISVEDGYALVWGDFAQSDFRIAYNLFLRSEMNDAIMSKYDDKYEGLARIVANNLGRTFDKEEFLQKRKLYKRLTLATMYGTRGSVVKEDDEFIKMFASFLGTCPRYVEYKKRLEAGHKLGLPILIHGYFGYEETCPVEYRETDTVNRALNAPIQTGTSEVIILTVNEILDRFYDLGYTEDDISIYLVRHDEPVFKVRKELLKDAWIFEDFNKIFVDDWMPLQLSFEVGYYYGVPDEELTSVYKQSIAKNKAKISSLEEIPSDGYRYYPTPKVWELDVDTVQIGESTLLTVYDADRKLAHNSIIYATDSEQVFLAVRQVIEEAEIDSDEFRGVVVHSTFPSLDETRNGMYFKYQTTGKSALGKVDAISRFAACKYCKSRGIESPVNPPLETMSSLIQETGKLTEIK